MHITGELSDGEIVVVGGGAVGVCISYRLAQAGARVSLVERNYPGAGTTNQSFAWLNAFGKFPKTYNRFNLDGIRDHRDLADELGGDWLTLSGAIHWGSATGESQFGAVSDTVKRLRGWGVRVEEHTAEEVTRLIEPGVVFPEGFAQPVYFVRGEGWLQPALMVQGVLQSARRDYGLRIVRDEVVGFSGDRGEVTGVVLESGERIGADVVVAAAGPDTNRLAGIADSGLRIEGSEGVLIVSALCPANLKHVLIGPNLVIRPDGGGRMLMSSEELLAYRHGSRFDVTRPEVSTLLTRVRDLMPDMARVGVEAVRQGVRPIPPDGYPIIGFDTQVRGLYWAVMHSGITLSARTGKLVADDLCSAPDPALEPYRPDRLIGGTTVQGPSAE